MESLCVFTFGIGTCHGLVIFFSVLVLLPNSGLILQCMHVCAYSYVIMCVIVCWCAPSCVSVRVCVCISLRHYCTNNFLLFVVSTLWWAQQPHRFLLPHDCFVMLLFNTPQLSCYIGPLCQVIIEHPLTTFSHYFLTTMAWIYSTPSYCHVIKEPPIPKLPCNTIIEHTLTLISR